MTHFFYFQKMINDDKMKIFMKTPISPPSVVRTFSNLDPGLETVLRPRFQKNLSEGIFPT